MKHNFKPGELVHWTLDGRTLVPFTKNELWIGIVTQIGTIAAGVEVHWFNNGITKVLNCESLLKAEQEKPER